jgi:hypothetical protein
MRIINQSLDIYRYNKMILVQCNQTKDTPSLTISDKEIL